MLDFSFSQRACQCLVQNVVGQNKSYVDSVPLLKWTDIEQQVSALCVVNFQVSFLFYKNRSRERVIESTLVEWVRISIDHYLQDMILRIMSFLRSSLSSGQSRITGVIHKSIVFVQPILN